MVRHLSYMQFYVGSNPTWWTKVRYFMSKYENLLVHQHRTKERILFVMGEKCQLCGYSKCNKALELHHIDPKEKDKTISGNLLNNAWSILCEELKKCILLCANCHREVHDNFSAFIDLKSSFNPISAQSIQKIIDEINAPGVEYVCVDCHKKVSGNYQRCRFCSAKHNQKVERPTREQLKELIRYHSFISIGDKYGVSDKAIIKWCIAENLPSRKKDIKQYSTEEWNEI